ncbi:MULTISPECIES: class I SAM-dependent methyltransferase [Mycolicibacterium]|uniref:Putative S-adenosyl-L-methionine-dependent methyltransferase Mflv_5024 n=3 Tax=Mycolicibacterium gilvum TaxID=1804 RepID=Y5024_MYCGI|nr:MULTISPECIES: class I SAM-dependent methyltransferase [Mycolicibacterium]A4TEE0.1 RecName: Full=Putative S-adenosyl-L-methionine-dependent methyltransferase Mflv_5024 [Mycolicibacterium gilvum PYR-GCK]ABP47490.1 putative methyltransferase [Mycolicibacterium gilvum PYR-GCK]ADU00998.1 methyltransferase, putative, TIGR00027 family [Mycolicibacterium gilvum Spyr1]MBV5242550.1 class I SAM-dependent methyltransferase [Mycolicibacterium sp. PAM1]MCV7058650.1 class I SAM-dependent methyltransferase
MARTDGDTWDLASSVGATATSVAASRAFASRGPDALIDDPYARLLVEAVGLPHFVKVARGEIDFDGDPLFGAQQAINQIVVRTRIFDDFLTDAGQREPQIRQAVILASGLDTRAYRLDWPAGTVVYEIDQPEVIDFKTAVLTDAGVAPAADRRTVGIDLREDWPTALRDAGFDPDRPTAWIAEGLLPYLPPDAQDRLLDSITALSAPGSRLATEHMDAKALTGDWAKAMTERARRHGSDIDLTKLFYNGERRSATEHLGAVGWQTSVQTSNDAYIANGFGPIRDDLLAMIGDSGYLTAWRP